MHPVRRHCQALFEKISGSEELKAEDERLGQKKAAEDDQQYNLKKRALGQERNNTAATRRLAFAAASRRRRRLLGPITVRCCTTAAAKKRPRSTRAVREGRRAQTAALLIALFGIEVEVTSCTRS